MALTKAKQTAANPEEVKAEEPKTPEEVIEPKAPVKTGELVACELVKGNWLYQPSTKKRIVRGSIEELKVDGWLSLQVQAGLIKLVG
jgi:hypothetical protein